MLKLSIKPHPHKTEKDLERLKRREYLKEINSIVAKGVEALQNATPKRTGKTASSWSYEIQENSNGVTIFWKNDNVTRDGDPIAILIQYGHGTGTGGYVSGVDYINPAMKSVFDDIVNAAWKVVTSR